MPFVFNPFTGKLDFTNPGSTFDPHSPGPIGDVTPSTGAFTTLSATSGNNATGLTITGGSITGSGTTPWLNITGTWNTTGDANAIFANITNTASGANSNAIQIQVNGTPIFTIGKDGNFRNGVTATGNIFASNNLQAGGGLLFAGGSTILGQGNGAGHLIVIGTTPAVDFGGTTNAFPSLIRSGSVITARLADDSAFTAVQCILRTTANAVAETPSATHTVLIQDASGTSYKVLVVPA
jgi:hypothetical protein